jgi:hypothetical protein
MLNGTSCGPGWPFSVSPYHTSLWVSGYVDSKNDKLWFPTNDAGHSGFGCLDISNFTTGPKWCGGSAGAGKGFIVNSATAGSTTWGATDRIVNVGTKIYSLTATGLLMCLDVSKSANCAAPTFDTGSGLRNKDAPAFLLVVGSKIFGVGGNFMSTVGFCVDTSVTPVAACTGGTWPLAPGVGYQTVYKQPDATGKLEAVCFKYIVTAKSALASCYEPDGSDTTTLVPTRAGLAESLVAATGYEYDFALPLTVGTRVYSGDGDYHATGHFLCFDVATSAKCAGTWPKDTSVYAIVADPTLPGCVWTNNNDGQIRSFLANGTLGCYSASKTNDFSPTLPCTGGTIAQWQSFTLAEPTTGYTAAKLTVTKAGAVVTSGGKTWSSVPITGKKHSVDLSGLAVEDTGTAPTFTVTYSGLTATGNAKATVVMGISKAKDCMPTVTPDSPFTGTTRSKTKGKRRGKTLGVGDRTTVTLTARNGGTVTSRGTKFVMVVPSAFRIVRAPGAKVKGRTVTWTIGSLKARKSATRSLVLQAVGRGSHSLAFDVTSTNLVNTTASASTISISSGSALSPTG